MLILEMFLFLSELKQIQNYHSRLITHRFSLIPNCYLKGVPRERMLDLYPGYGHFTLSHTGGDVLEMITEIKIF